MCGALVLVLAAPASSVWSAGGPDAAIVRVPTLLVQDGEPSAAEQELASKFAPILYMQAQSQPCGDGDPFTPVDLDALFGQPAIRFRPSATALEATPGPVAADLFGQAAGTFLDFPGDPRSPGCTYEQDFLSFAGEGRGVAYAHVATEAGQPGLALQYWFFHYFNDWNNRHEGDWEMIQLVFEEDTPEEALQSEPATAIYSQHATAERADWSDSKVRKEDGRPVVYPSSGSHASYFAPGVYVGKGESGAGFGCDDATGPHRRVDLEAVAVPGRVTDTGSEFAWLTFEGRWGQELRGHNNGPTGPNTKRSWREPLTFAEEVDRTSNLTVPGGSALGLSATDVFCGVIARGSELLFTVSNHWVLSLAVLGTVVTTVAVSSTALIREMRRSGAALRRRFVLIQRRSFGAILVAAWHVYREHWLTWVAIAAGLLPVALVLSLAMRLLVGNPPIETLLSVTDDRGISVLLMLLYGVGSSLPFLIVASAGVIAGMRELRDNEEPSLTRAYGEVVSRGVALLGARLKALAIIALLAISVLGLPWAVKRTVDWYFIEQAILLDGRSRAAAPRASAWSVGGQWWRTFGITLVLGFVGAFEVPLLGAILILLTSIPLWLLNLMSSVGYVVLLPFVAIALSFTYWDLQSREQARASIGEGAAARAESDAPSPAD